MIKGQEEILMTMPHAVFAGLALIAMAMYFGMSGGTMPAKAASSAGDLKRIERSLDRIEANQGDLMNGHVMLIDSILMLRSR